MGFMTERQRDMVSENHDLIYEFLRKYGYSEDEYYGVAAIGLCNACVDFVDSIGEFQKYAEKCMLREVRQECRGRRGSDGMVPCYIDECGSELDDCLSSSMEELVIARVMLSEITQMLEEQEKRIMRMVLSGFGQKEIVRALRVSPAKVTYVRGIARKYLR